jgi:uncharacterized membrane protein YgcG
LYSVALVYGFRRVSLAAQSTFCFPRSLDPGFSCHQAQIPQSRSHVTRWNRCFSAFSRDAMESLLLCFLTCNHMQASNGQAMGKRLVVCTGMAWYWQPGFWNIVMCLVIFGVGSFLSAFAEVVKEETEQQSGDGQPHASTSSSSSPGGSSGPSGQSGGGGKKGRGKHR